MKSLKQIKTNNLKINKDRENRMIKNRMNLV